MFGYTNRFFYLPSPILFAVSLIMIIALGMYGISFKEIKDQEIQLSLSNAVYTQEEVCLSYLNVVSVTGDRITGIDRRGRTYKFLSNGFKPQIGKSYAFIGKLNTEGLMIISGMQEYPLRSYKYLFSSLSIILFLYLVIRFIRFNRKEYSFYLKLSQGEAA